MPCIYYNCEQRITSTHLEAQKDHQHTLESGCSSVMCLPSRSSLSVVPISPYEHLLHEL